MWASSLLQGVMVRKHWRIAAQRDRIKRKQGQAWRVTFMTETMACLASFPRHIFFYALRDNCSKKLECNLSRWNCPKYQLKGQCEGYLNVMDLIWHMVGKTPTQTPRGLKTRLCTIYIYLFHRLFWEMYEFLWPVRQFSSSYFQANSFTECHIFFIMNKLSCKLLKTWKCYFENLNLEQNVIISVILIQETVFQVLAAKQVMWSNFGSDTIFITKEPWGLTVIDMQTTTTCAHYSNDATVLIATKWELHLPARSQMAYDLSEQKKNLWKETSPQQLSFQLFMNQVSYEILIHTFQFFLHSNLSSRNRHPTFLTANSSKRCWAVCLSVFLLSSFSVNLLECYLQMWRVMCEKCMFSRAIFPDVYSPKKRCSTYDIGHTLWSENVSGIYKYCKSCYGYQAGHSISLHRITGRYYVTTWN